MPEDAIYVGRPTKWGNPCRWTEYPAYPPAHYADGELRDMDDFHRIPDAVRRRFSVMDFEALIRWGIGRRDSYPSDTEIRSELAGKNLVCWCPLDQPCHADVLLRLANEAGSR